MQRHGLIANANSWETDSLHGDVDNADASAHRPQMTPKFFADSDLCKLVHPVDSPDFSPSNFCLFGKLKNQLISQSVQDDQDLLDKLI
jgi:hypothetical protein